MKSSLRLLTAGVFLWAGLVRAEPMLTGAPRVRFWSQRIVVAEKRSVERIGEAAPEIGILLAPGLAYRYDGDLFMLATLHGEPSARVADFFGAFARAMNEASVVARFGVEPFERRAFDFGRRCFNTCPLGGWGSCVFETRGAKEEECEGIAGRTMVSAAARRAPLVREVLKLVGSRTTSLPTDVDRGLRLSTNLVRGGGTLGVEARW